ncbi:CLIP domain-containing serine protease 2 [Drosophila elegans]|uniref:CLIP domain-containing serine protease 2 n=1 Tax=Drosophila elegans TaxID=30023 RepID=UPI0007E82919|nr:CLIP domain-containing serine protease 2 [Drosophila elegans]
MRLLRGVLYILCLLLATCHVLGQQCSDSTIHKCVPRHTCRYQLGYRALEAGNFGCHSTEICCKNDNLRTDKQLVVVDEPVNPNCGWVNSRGVTFVMSDLEGMAQEAELPWMVALLNVNREYLAGGVLISPDVVVTARHVTDNLNANQLIVRAGEWDFKTDTEQLPHVDAGVRLIIRHPGFIKNTGANNVALLFLQAPLKLASNINPICLPKSDRNFDYTRCIFSGWGKQSFQDYAHMNIMKKVELPVVPSDRCQYALRRYYGNEWELDNSLMCAGGEPGKDSCKGDGGSPLACPLLSDPQRYELAGIVNFGVDCGIQGVPGVYTNVAKFRNWIIQETNRVSNVGEQEPVFYPPPQPELSIPNNNNIPAIWATGQQEPNFDRNEGNNQGQRGMGNNQGGSNYNGPSINNDFSNGGQPPMQNPPQRNDPGLIWFEGNNQGQRVRGNNQDGSNNYVPSFDNGFTNGAQPNFQNTPTQWAAGQQERNRNDRNNNYNPNFDNGLSNGGQVNVPQFGVNEIGPQNVNPVWNGNDSPIKAVVRPAIIEPIQTNNEDDEGAAELFSTTPDYDFKLM